VLVRPHLTEKSSALAEAGQYTFLVTPDAEKVTIVRAVAARYGVHPVAVHIINLPGKRVRYGKTEGQRSAVKKAIVTLQKGEKIPFGVKS
jgi:large subunit ribosomal protein L23